MSLPLKAGIGLVTIGTVGGVGYGIVAYSKDQGTEISKLIEKEYEYILLKTEGETDKAHWTTNWGNYKKDHADKQSDLFGLNNWETLKSRDDASELKKKCQELSSQKILNKEDKLYENVGKYCGRSVTVQDEVTKNNLTILKTEVTGDGSTGVGTIWKKRHTLAATDLKIDLNKLGIAKTNPSEEEIKTGCNTAKAKNKKDEKYQEFYDAFIKVCTKQEGETIT